MKILLAVDESSHSVEAVQVVAERPWPQGTVVRVLTVVQPFVPPAAEFAYDAAGAMQQVWQERRDRSGGLVDHVVRTLQTKGLSAEPFVCDGEPRSTIVDEAKDWGADLIVLGSHGHTGITRWLLGSVAQYVVSHAPCSVEVVRLRPGQAV
jgi:nucleotide-binding universal stress UspA family protein